MPPPPPESPAPSGTARWHQASELQNQDPDPAGSKPSKQAPDPPLPPPQAETAPWLDYSAAGKWVALQIARLRGLQMFLL